MTTIGGCRASLFAATLGAVLTAAEGDAPVPPRAATPARASTHQHPRTPPGPSIRWVRAADGGRISVEVLGFEPAALTALAEASRSAEEWSALLSVTIAGDSDRRTPMLGTYRVERDLLRFTPRFPLVAGLRYRAELDPDRLPARGATAGGPRVSSEFSLPEAPPGAPTTVVAVYPSAEVLPENLLRFYVHFSAPMSRGEAYGRVRLLDASGKALELPFLELAEELWDPPGKRLTLLFDPGRIKTGLKPREEAGPILEKGRRYTLVIDRAWPDARGKPLRAELRKTFRAGPADESPPDPKRWRIDPPAAGSRDPLSLSFPEPLDHAMLGRVLAVSDPRGNHVPGRVEIGAGETRWQLFPERAWEPGRYAVLVDDRLEDRSGNSIARPFEVDVFRTIQRRETAKTVTLPFLVR